jgi:putative hydrolase of the HAD superfamily
VTRQHLIVDADDTLWENNIYFERAFHDFVEYLAHSSLSPREIRDVVDEIELANARIHGYGSANFGRNLQECYRRLKGDHIEPEALDTVMSFARRILENPIEVIDGVADTLAYLAPRHDLTLFTKGDPDEQRLKLDRSGLAPMFAHTAIVKEKDAPAYARLVAERKMDSGIAWMIGNSPKSDINPALAAGLNAVFVPHPDTWALEKQEIVPGPGKLLVVERFRDLREHF